MTEQHNDNGSVAPPPFEGASAPGGRGQDIIGTDHTAGDGGIAGSLFDCRGPVERALSIPPNEFEASAWDVVANAANDLSELGEFLEETDANPTLRSAATLRSLDRFRDALDRMPAEADLNQTVELRVQDVALVARSMLSRLR